MDFSDKKKAEAELKKRKKDYLGPKLGEKIENNVQKLPNLNKKKKTFWASKTSWG